MEEIVDCIKNVEHILGNHYKENIYQFALYTELNLRGYMVQTEVIVPVYYKSVYVGFERADLVIYNKDATIMCILELKSQNARLGNKEINQLRKYLNNTSTEYGILVNFYESLEMVRVNKISHQKISCDTSQI